MNKKNDEEPIEVKKNGIQQPLNNNNSTTTTIELNNLVLEKLNAIPQLQEQLNVIQQLLEEKNTNIKQKESKKEKEIVLRFLEPQENPKGFMRSYRLDYGVARLFAVFFTTQHFSQQDLLSQALFEFIQKYSPDNFIDEHFH